MPIRVLIADDTELMRLAIATLLEREPRIEVVGEAANFAETLKLTTTALEPDVLLLDLQMPDERRAPTSTRIGKKSCGSAHWVRFGYFNLE
jgi:DNA-binding NarL/FixJ family response regulator